MQNTLDYETTCVYYLVNILACNVLFFYSIYVTQRKHNRTRDVQQKLKCQTVILHRAYDLMRKIQYYECIIFL